MIVADANLLVYLVFRGVQTPTARAVAARDAEWAAPPLWSSEVLSALGRYVQRGDVSLADASEMYSGAADAIGDREFEPEPPDVLRLAAASGCSTYDCEYVAVARGLGVPLVTADREVLRAFPGIAMSPEAFVRKPPR